jgi:hypothetical protein
LQKGGKPTAESAIKRKGEVMKIKFLDGSEKEFADLAGANLTDADLRDADLRDANLRVANLRGADLRGADLTRADLTRADLTRADLTGADLTRADLTGADLTSANLTDADLRVADLRGTNLTGADLTRANLTDANLTGADLTRANIDFSSWPLWCGSLKVKVDRRIACQLLYHALAVMARCDDEEVKELSMSPDLLKFASEFHRRGGCAPIHETQEVVPQNSEPDKGRRRIESATGKKINSEGR